MLRALTILALMGLLTTPGLASAERDYPARAAGQLGRGIMNLVASPWEVPVNMLKEQQRADDDGSNYVGQGAAVLRGTFLGIGYMVSRLLVGTAEILTFPLPTRPFMKPANPNVLLETLGPPSSYSFFRLQRRGAQLPRQQRRFWTRAGEDDEVFYDDRWDCAAELHTRSLPLLQTTSVRPLFN